MNSNTRWDSLVWIIIWIFILSFILVWMVNVIWYSKDISYNYENKIEENLIQKNSENIIEKLDKSSLNKQEEFYIQKDTWTKEFKIMTWAINKEYSYINKLWNNTSSWSEGKIFQRVYNNKIDILRHITYPTEIKDLVFHFDANYINWTWWTNPSDWDTINTWKDLSWNNFNATNSSWTPTFYESELNENPVIWFDWIYNFSINDNSLIDTNTFNEKSFSVIFKTWYDLNWTQEIYNQWNWTNWYEIYINNKILYIWIKDTNFDLWEILPDTAYFITIIQNWNNVKNYINWYLNKEWTIISNINSHSTIKIWKDFKWKIWELISWNHTLTKEEIDWVSNYFKDKWLKWNENIRYNIIETNVSLIK